jgi:hypothetical protein
MKLKTLTMNAILVWILVLVTGPIVIGRDRPADNTTGIPLPVFPLIINYDYETQYFMQWIANCPQYSLISASVSKGEPQTIQMVLTETTTGRRNYYSNSDSKVKLLKQAGLNAHLVRIDFKTGQDNDDRPVFAFGFPDEHGIPIRWGFVANGPSSNRGAGPRVQAVNGGVLVSYNELGTTAAPGALVQIGAKSYQVEEWPEISKPPYFIGYRGTYSEGIALGVLLKGAENWQIQSAPTSLSEGARWTLVDDRKFVRTLQVASRRGDELIISELVDKASFGSGIEMTVKLDGNHFALKSISQKAGVNSLRMSFVPELRLSAEQSAVTEHTFQIDENSHQKVLQGAATLEVLNGNLVLKLKPKAANNRQVTLPKDYVLTSTIKVNPSGYSLEVR